MKHYAELGTVYRNQPCIEFPGSWLVYVDGNELGQYPTFQEAYDFATEQWEAPMSSVDTKVSVCWACSENDPRVGEVWFTGFYQHGTFDQFGRYKS